MSSSEATQAQQSSKGNLLILVEPHLKDLSELWLNALRDQAILKLPAEIASHLPEQGKCKANCAIDVHLMKTLLKIARVAWW